MEISRLTIILAEKDGGGSKKGYTLIGTWVSACSYGILHRKRQLKFDLNKMYRIRAFPDWEKSNSDSKTCPPQC